MPAELLNAFASVGTFIVVAVTAVAAQIQLAHLRRSNQLQIALDLGNEFGAIAKHIGFVYNALPEKMKDPELSPRVGFVISADEHPELLVCASFSIKLECSCGGSSRKSISSSF